MTTYSSPNAPSVYFGTQIVWFIVGAIEILLALRFVLKLLAANGSATFTNVIYSLTDILVAPFTAVFSVTYAAGTIFEWTTILAAIIYFVIAAGIINLFLMGEDIGTPEASARLRN